MRAGRRGPRRSRRAKRHPATTASGRRCTSRARRPRSKIRNPSRRRCSLRQGRKRRSGVSPGRHRTPTGSSCRFRLLRTRHLRRRPRTARSRARSRSSPRAASKRRRRTSSRPGHWPRLLARPGSGVIYAGIACFACFGRGSLMLVRVTSVACGFVAGITRTPAGQECCHGNGRGCTAGEGRHDQSSTLAYARGSSVAALRSFRQPSQSLPAGCSASSLGTPGSQGGEYAAARQRSEGWSILQSNSVLAARLGDCDAVGEFPGASWVAGVLLVSGHHLSFSTRNAPCRPASIAVADGPNGSGRSTTDEAWHRRFLSMRGGGTLGAWWFEATPSWFAQVVPVWCCWAPS